MSDTPLHPQFRAERMAEFGDALGRFAVATVDMAKAGMTRESQDKYWTAMDRVVSLYEAALVFRGVLNSLERAATGEGDKP